MLTIINKICNADRRVHSPLTQEVAKAITISQAIKIANTIKKTAHIEERLT